MANELHAAGKSVTVDALLDRLGGSRTTLNQSLRLWKAANNLPLRKPLSEDEMRLLSTLEIQLISPVSVLRETDGDQPPQTKRHEAEIARLLRKIDRLEKKCADLEERHTQSERERESLVSGRIELERQLTDVRETFAVFISCTKDTDAENTRLRRKNEELKHDLSTEKRRAWRHQQDLEDYLQRTLSPQSQPPISPSPEAPNPL